MRTYKRNIVHMGQNDQELELTVRDFRIVIYNHGDQEGSDNQVVIDIFRDGMQVGFVPIHGNGINILKETNRVELIGLLP